MGFSFAMKILLLVLTFLKMLHFVGVFEELGFFVAMLLQCISRLGDFAVSYVAFGLCFAVTYQVMGARGDEELASAVYLGDFGRLFLLVWRNGVGKLGMVIYPEVARSPAGFFKTLNIQLIWILYYTQVLF